MKIQRVECDEIFLRCEECGREDFDSDYFLKLNIGFNEITLCKSCLSDLLESILRVNYDV